MTWQPTEAAHLLILALKEVGKPYRLGSEGPVDASLPAWDCSELVQHLLAMVGITEIVNDIGLVTAIADFDGAGRQWERCRRITVAQARALPAGLLFVQSPTSYPDKPHHIGHVALSLGNGYTLEARGKAYGVGIWPIRASFNAAGKVAELYV